MNVIKGTDLHPKDHSIQVFTDASNEGWGTHLEQTSTKGLWSYRNKCSRVEGSISGHEKGSGPGSESNSIGCYG